VDGSTLKSLGVLTGLPQTVQGIVVQ